MTRDLKGMYAALMTGLTDTGDFSPERQTNLNKYVLGQGLAGLYVGGSSGESGLLDLAALKEQQNVVAKDCAGHDTTLIAHVGMASTRDSVDLAKTAQSLGYHALSALPPHAYPFSDLEIIEYYRELSAATDLPLIVYEVPIRTGRPIPLDVLTTILDLPGVAGIKFTSTDLYKLALLRRSRPDALYYFGFDEVYLSGAALGVSGGIGTTYNLLGKLYVALNEAIQGGDLPRAQELQAVSADFVADLLDIGVLPGMKSALRAIGVDAGPTRAPMIAKVADADARMKKVVERADIKPWLA